MEPTYRIVILDDGSTYSAADGASILVITEKGNAKLEQGYEAKDLKKEDILSEIVFSDKTR